MRKKEQFEEIPTIRPGDKVLRRQRRRRSPMHTLSRRLSALLRHKSSK